MTKVRVVGFTVSLDGYGTGEPQTLQTPFGATGKHLHRWMNETMQRMSDPQTNTGPEADLLRHDWDSIGAYIMGRNMFSPNRGEEDPSWRGWWGDNPPYQCPVYVMTHYPREDLAMEGGTVFRFVSGTPEEVLQMARETAGNKDIQVGGGVTTVRTFLQKGLVDEVKITVAPAMVGTGERLWDGLDDLLDLYNLVDSQVYRNATHLRLVRRTD